MLLNPKNWDISKLPVPEDSNVDLLNRAKPKTYTSSLHAWLILLPLHCYIYKFSSWYSNSNTTVTQVWGSFQCSPSRSTRTLWRLLNNCCTCSWPIGYCQLVAEPPCQMGHFKYAFHSWQTWIITTLIGSPPCSQAHQISWVSSATCLSQHIQWVVHDKVNSSLEDLSILCNSVIERTCANTPSHWPSFNRFLQLRVSQGIKSKAHGRRYPALGASPLHRRQVGIQNQLHILGNCNLGAAKRNDSSLNVQFNSSKIMELILLLHVKSTNITSIFINHPNPKWFTKQVDTN